MTNKKMDNQERKHDAVAANDLLIENTEHMICSPEFPDGCIDLELDATEE